MPSKSNVNRLLAALRVYYDLKREDPVDQNDLDIIGTEHGLESDGSPDLFLADEITQSMSKYIKLAYEEIPEKKAGVISEPDMIKELMEHLSQRLWGGDKKAGLGANHLRNYYLEHEEKYRSNVKAAPSEPEEVSDDPFMRDFKKAAKSELHKQALFEGYQRTVHQLLNDLKETHSIFSHDSKRYDNMLEAVKKLDKVLQKPTSTPKERNEQIAKATKLMEKVQETSALYLERKLQQLDVKDNDRRRDRSWIAYRLNCLANGVMVPRNKPENKEAFFTSEDAKKFKESGRKKDAEKARAKAQAKKSKKTVKDAPKKDSLGI